ncbi:MAG: undecaprenyl-diphosphate phosphatase [Clostridia bacterium]|nr:undecaprenyl-diphosphate phosphatase [Clostridia bacterium]
MKTSIKHIFIGFIQGLTEFLPVSSSGHIVLFGSMFSLDNLMLISIVAHIGTLFAVLFCYRNKIIELIKHPKNPTNLNLILATIPAVVIVLIFNEKVESLFSIKSLTWGFIISAFLLLIADFKPNKNKYINKRASFIMGIAQGLAILPGISRSGATLTCGLLCNRNKKETLDFSFLMSIPIILASAVYESFNLFSSQINIEWGNIFLVMISSFIFGILSIKLMLKIVKNNKLYYFSIYMVVLSLLIVFLF